MKNMKKIFLAIVMLATSVSFAQISTTISAPNTASVNDSIVMVNQNKKATHLTVFELSSRIRGIPVHNATGGTLLSGKAVYPIGSSTLGVTNIDYAIANSHETIENQVGLLDGDILDGENGIVILSGILETDTSTYSEGSVYISPTVAGDLTNTRPEFPDYSILMGVVTDVGVSGKIAVDIRDNVDDIFTGFWNGTITQSFVFNVTSDGATITGSLMPANGHPDLTMVFSGGLVTLDTSPAATITLTGGVDTNPQLNYVYIPESSKVLTVSTAGFPVAEHIKIASLFLRSAATTQTEGALRNQNFNDHIEDTNTFQGHLSHITSRIRTLDAKWESGVAGTSTINTGPTPDDVFVSTTGGTVRQLHLQSFPAQDIETGDDIHVVNNLASPYVTITNLNTQILDSQGNTLNNTSFSFVVWGVINSDGEESHIMLNLPTDSYAFASPEDAVEDTKGFSDYTIPKSFEGVGFLIVRFTYTYKNNAWTLFDTTDLRGTTPNTTAGGGIGGAGVSEFTSLTDTPNSYLGDAGKIYQVNVGETALEATDSPSFVDLVVNNEINTDSFGILVNEKNGDGTTTDFKSFIIRDGKGNNITFFNGDTKAVISYGDVHVGDAAVNSTIVKLILASDVTSKLSEIWSEGEDLYLDPGLTGEVIIESNLTSKGINLKNTTTSEIRATELDGFTYNSLDIRGSEVSINRGAQNRFITTVSGSELSGVVDVSGNLTANTGSQVWDSSNSNSDAFNWTANLLLADRINLKNFAGAHAQIIGFDNVVDDDVSIGNSSGKVTFLSDAGNKEMFHEGNSNGSAFDWSTNNLTASGNTDLGGGYGNTGTSISNNGDISTNGALVVDGTGKMNDLRLDNGILTWDIKGNVGDMEILALSGLTRKLNIKSGSGGTVDLVVQGSVTGTVFIPTSDERLKSNKVIDLEPRKLNTEYYHYNLMSDEVDENGNRRMHYSVLAQDLIKNGYNEYVYRFKRSELNEETGENVSKTYYGVNMTELHSEEIAYLKSENEKYKSLINSLTLRIFALENK